MYNKEFLVVLGAMPAALLARRQRHHPRAHAPRDAFGEEGEVGFAPGVERFYERFKFAGFGHRGPPAGPPGKMAGLFLRGVYI